MTVHDLTTFVNISNTQLSGGNLVPIGGGPMKFLIPAIDIAAGTPHTVNLTVTGSPFYVEAYGQTNDTAGTFTEDPGDFIAYDDDADNDDIYVVAMAPGFNNFNSCIADGQTNVGFVVTGGSPVVTQIESISPGASSAAGSLSVSGTMGAAAGTLPATASGSISFSGTAAPVAPNNPLTIRDVVTIIPGIAGASGGIPAPTNQAGDRIVLIRQGKQHSSRTPVTPMPLTGGSRLAVYSDDAPSTLYTFSLIASLHGGTGTFGADSGPTFTEVYAVNLPVHVDGLQWSDGFPNYPDSEIMSIYVIAPAVGQLHQFALTDSNWYSLVADTSTAADLQATFALAAPPTAGDLVIVSGVQPTDFGASTGHTVSAPGLSGGTVTQRVSQTSSLNNDCAVVGVSYDGFTGTASGSLASQLVTLGSDHSGTLVALLFRQGLGISAGMSGSMSLSGTAAGTATQAATASGSITFGADMIAVAVTPPPPPQRAGGRYRKGRGRLLWEPPVTVPARSPGTHVYDLLSTFSVPTYPNVNSQPVYNVNWVYKERARDRIVLGGKDITEWRGARTPTPSYQLIIPMRYGPAVLELPQVNGVFERPGHGALRFMRPGARLKIQRIDEDGDIIATDYIGFVVGYRVDGADLVVEIGGELSGRAALIDKQVPIFRSRHDAGEMLWEDCRDAGITLKPRLGAQTGVRLWKFGGGMSVADHINQVCALATKRSGAMYTVMPNAQGHYHVTQKDIETIHGTIYFDDARVKPSLIRDTAEEPNRIFVSAVAPNGRKIRFATYPGLVQDVAPEYPMDGGATFGIGTVDADTLYGDGVTVMMNRLVVTRLLNFGNDTYPGGYDQDVADAVSDLQEKAGILPVTGNMTPKTWNALFDLSATGYSLNWSKILPAADDTRVRRWLRTASGSIRKANPNFQVNRIKRDASIELGNGFWEYQARNFARKELRLTGEGNWVGEVTTKCSFVWGEHTPGDPVVEADVMTVRDVIPGMNLWAPLWDGGTLFHVAAVTISEDGDKGSFSLDTQFRDTMKVWQIIERNRESRRDPARTWVQQHRRSQLVPDALGPWDNIGGTVEKIYLYENRWKVFPIVAGQEGTIARLRMNTDPNAEYCVAIFGRRIYEAKLQKRIGNPLEAEGAERWKNEKIRRSLDKSNILLYVAGDNEDPCGYDPKSKSEGGELTGKWLDDAGIQYRTFKHPVLWVAVFADRDTSIRAGRIAWPQMEEGS